MLFTAVEQLKDYRPITKNFEWTDIVPFIRDSEEDSIIPFMSQGEYDVLNTKIANTTIRDSAEYAQLLSYARRALANIAYYKYIPYGNVSLSKSGIGVTESGDTKIASQWRVEDLKQSCLDGYYSGIELMLMYMETQKTVFTSWAASPSFTEFKDCFINTSTDFSLNFGSSVSRRVFLLLKSIMKRVEQDQIASVTGAALFAEIKTQITAGNTTSQNKLLLNFIQPAVANFTIEKASSLLPVKINDQGIQVLTTGLNRDNEAVTESADRDRINDLKRHCFDEGNKEKQKLYNYLYANASTYPLYAADATVYSATPSAGYNDKNNGSVYMM